MLCGSIDLQTIGLYVEGLFSGPLRASLLDLVQVSLQLCSLLLLLRLLCQIFYLLHVFRNRPQYLMRNTPNDDCQRVCGVCVWCCLGCHVWVCLGIGRVPCQTYLMREELPTFASMSFRVFFLQVFRTKVCFLLMSTLRSMCSIFSFCSMEQARLNQTWCNLLTSSQTYSDLFKLAQSDPPPPLPPHTQ